MTEVIAGLAGPWGTVKQAVRKNLEGVSSEEIFKIEVLPGVYVSKFSEGDDIIAYYCGNDSDWDQVRSRLLESGWVECPDQ